MDVNCYEPGLHGTVQAIVTANAHDRLIFPHVDSCMALCLLLNNQQMVGGHVPMQLGQGAPLAPAANAQRFLMNMLRLATLQLGGQVTLLISCGDERSLAAQGQTYGLGTLSGMVHQRHLHLEATGYAVNVYVDGLAGTVTVNDYDPPNAQLFQRAFGALAPGIVQL